MSKKRRSFTAPSDCLGRFWLWNPGARKRIDCLCCSWPRTANVAPRWSSTRSAARRSMRNWAWNHQTRPRHWSRRSETERWPVYRETNQSLPTDATDAHFLSAHGLPLEATPFIGRAEELTSILRRLQDPTCRLLTLAGPGGIGKTRLAVEAVRHFIHEPGTIDRFQDGIYFVRLSTVQSFDGIAVAVAQALGYRLHDHEAPRHGLLDLLQGKRLLLILDNFEHLHNHAGLISDILNASPFIKAIVTSRIGLNIGEEWFHVVAGLSVPPPRRGKGTREQPMLRPTMPSACSSSSARRSLVNFSLAEEQEHVVKICRLVEGTPLAIELAAAWLKALPDMASGRGDRSAIWIFLCPETGT